MTILQEIVRKRRTDVERAGRDVSVESLRQEAAGRTFRSLSESIRRPGSSGVIAEIKKASPSAGLIRGDFDPAALAREYSECGAAGISVLTEPNRFLGGPDDLRLARDNSSLPILRKDFMIDTYQMYEAAAWGADAVLLIAAALDPNSLQDLYATARSLSLEVIVEIHSENELPVALACQDAIVGVNSRDLTSMQTDLSVAFRIRNSIPGGRLTLAESGIRSRQDIVALRDAGYDAFLVGEILMRSLSPGSKLRELTGADS